MTIQNLPFDILNSTIRFSKKLATTDINAQLSVPSHILEQFPPSESPEIKKRALHARSLNLLRPPFEPTHVDFLSTTNGLEYDWDFTAFGKNCEEWNFVLHRRSGNAKPVLQRGEWHAFVKYYGLDANDGFDYGVIFYEDHNQPNRMQVRGLRDKGKGLRIFGSRIWDWEML